MMSESSWLISAWKANVSVSEAMAGETTFPDARRARRAGGGGGGGLRAEEKCTRRGFVGRRDGTREGAERWGFIWPDEGFSNVLPDTGGRGAGGGVD